MHLTNDFCYCTQRKQIVCLPAKLSVRFLRLGSAKILSRNKHYHHSQRLLEESAKYEAGDARLIVFIYFIIVRVEQVKTI